LSRLALYCKNNKATGVRHMVEIIEDIETLENAIILLKEGASDEKRMAFDSLEKMLNGKKAVLEDFENQHEEEATI